MRRPLRGATVVETWGAGCELLLSTVGTREYRGIVHSDTCAVFFLRWVTLSSNILAALAICVTTKAAGWEEA